MPVTSVSSGTTSVKLASANSARRHLIVANTDANDLYVLLDTGTASATNYSFKVASGDEKAAPNGYDGDVYGVWAGDGTGAALVTQY